MSPKLASVVLSTLAALAVATLAPARSSPLAPQPVQLVASDRLTTLEVWPATGALPGTPSPTVIIIPGWNSGASLYTEVAKYLTGRGYVVAIFGHGDNSAVVADEWAGWTETAINLLVAQNATPSSPVFHEIDTTRLALVGHSLGGAVATQVTALDPRIKVLAIEGPNASDATFLDLAALISVPILAMDGSLDLVAPAAACSDVVLARAVSVAKGSIVVQGGCHTNCPADYDLNYIFAPGQWVLQPSPVWPYATWTYTFPTIPGVTPIPGPLQRAIAFPYLGGWLDRFLAGKKDTVGWTDGRKADAELLSGTLWEEYFSAGARWNP
ncbi:MAG TPA: alpha/beta hydrolase [Planctomycetota bacterium]|nr:alpha/beta hydrolase [Planctomycetota bacterium]